jgi:hypothetical protein
MPIRQAQGTASRVVAGVAALWLLLAAEVAHAQFTGAHRELYFNLSRDGFSLARLTNHPNFLANQPDATSILAGGLTTELNRGDDYGQRVRGWLTAPATGDYLFGLSSDETSVLLLSTDEDPLNKRRVAWVDPRAQPSDYTTHWGQESLPVPLVAGRRYYLEVLHHEANLIDHLSVRWRLPSGTTESPIPATRLVFEIPPLLLQDLADVSVEEGRSVTFAPRLANFLPLTYRWQRDDGDIGGGTNREYKLTNATLGDDGAVFRALVTNQAGNVATRAAALTVRRDTNGPVILGVVAAHATNVFVQWSEPVAPLALSPGAYALPGVSILDASFGNALDLVILRTTPLSAGNNYTLQAAGVTDRASTPNAMTTTQVVFTARQFNPQAVGPAAGTATAVSGGVDLSGRRTEVGSGESLQYAWQSVTGDFDRRVRVEGLDASDVWARAGLMVREELAGDSRMVAAMATPTLAGCFLEARTNAGGPTIRTGSFPPGFPNAWLRLQRTGDQFSAFAGQDGLGWQLLGTVSAAFSNRLYLGLALDSGRTNESAQAHFRDFSSPVAAANSLAVPRAESLGPSSRRTGLVISEIMYHPRVTNTAGIPADLEFVELFNSNPFPADLGGYRLSGDIDFSFPPGTTLAGGAFLVVAHNPAQLQIASGLTALYGPYTNTLPNDGGRIRLRDPNGAVLLEVNYESRPPWPVEADGAGHSLVLARPSYGEDAAEAWAASDAIGGSPGRVDPVGNEPLRTVVLNEFLAHTDAPQLDFIELHNHSKAPVELGGAWLTDDPATNKYRIPSPLTLPAGGFVSFTQGQLGFSLSAAGQRIFLVNAAQTRVIDAVAFEAQANGVASGRYPDGAKGFRPLAQPSPGIANAPPLVRPLVINEIFYHPLSENEADEFVELFNRGTNAVNLGEWRFIDGIEFTFPPNTLLKAGAYLVVAKNRTNLLAHYPNLNADAVVGDFDGSLSDKGERLALARPEWAIQSDLPGPVTSNRIYVVMEEVTYRDGGRWGRWADGGGSSLERIDPRTDGSLPSHWAESDETTKAPWTVIEQTGVLDNGADTADSLHVMMLEEGECLIDDVEVFPTGSPNRITSGTFEAGLGNWTLRGNHERSSLENVGYNSTRSLHLRASSRGDIGANKARVPFSSALTAGQTATIRAKVRWLRGWPEILLRLRGSYLEATGRLLTPTNPGTPGALNSRSVANAGPALTEVTHWPVVPAASQPLVIRARVSDPDGVAAVTLRYRLDPSTNLTSVAMTDDGIGVDAWAGDGIYSATLPGQAADTLVAFVVEATDGAGAPARFPEFRDDNGPVRECLVYFGSPTPGGSFGTYRFWITRQAITNWTQREVLSNERIPGTFVYMDQRVVYDAGARYAGSAAHQDQAAPDYSPVGTPNHYSIELAKDEPVLGTDNFNKIHGPGNNHHDDNTLQREVVAYWMAQQLGLPSNYKRFVTMFINGARRGSLMEDSQVPGRDVIDSVYPDDSDGDLFKVAVWYEFGLTGQALSFTGLGEGYLNNYTTTGGVKKRARYRQDWQPQAEGDTANDFTSLYLLVDAVNAPAGPAYVPGVNGLVDVENWMRTFALEHAVGNWDSFGYRNEQNMFAYKPRHDRWQLLIWDINIIFGGGTRGAPITTNGDLLEIDTADTGITALYNTPAYRRDYWRALAEIARGPFLNERADPPMDARFAAFEASGVHVTAPDLIKVWIAQRRTYILSELAKINTPFVSVSGPSALTVGTNFLVLSGTAPLEVRSIDVNGFTWPISWTTLTNWTVRLPLSQATNSLNITGRDQHGQPVPGAAGAISVVYTNVLPPPEGQIVINEIHYNPLVPEASFIELFNNSPTVSYDLSGWRLDGADYVFPSGAVMTNRQYLVLAKNRTVFAGVYGASNFVAGEFAGQFDDGGETLSLVLPGPPGGEERIIDRVRYEDDQPWPAAADGRGPSLQLIDPTQDNSRVANWSAQPGWVFATRTANIANATNLLFWIQTAGTVYLDDITLVGPGGTNIIENGDFESELVPSWLFPNNYAASVVVSNVSHGGRRSLLLVGSAGGGSFSTSVQGWLGSRVVTNVNYTLSFWCLAHTNSVTVFARTLPGSQLTATTVSSAIYASPGAANSSVATLPAFPNVWLNEVQTANFSGPVDNFGQLEPWLELHNAGTNTVELDGLYLTDDFAEPARWAFAPGQVLQPGEFKLVWADGQPGRSTATSWHTSFRLSGSTGSVALVRMNNQRPEVLDYFNYSGLGADLSYGSVPDGQPFFRQVLHTVTPAASNLGSPGSVFINEWMAANTHTLADPADGDYEDWFELYNAGPSFVDLTDYFLSDDPQQRTKFRIPAGYVIPPNQFLLVWADEETGQNSPSRADLHVNFRLGTGGESILLSAPDRKRLDSVGFGFQTNDVSEGRFADGAASLYAFTLPTPGGPNSRAVNDGTPLIFPPPERRIFLGQEALVSIVAVDPDLPLSYSLDGVVPAGAVMNPVTGLFSWTPTPAQAPSTNDFVVRVTDHANPPQSATRSWRVVVLLPVSVTAALGPVPGVVSLSWPSLPGRVYRVDFKNALDDPVWQPLGAPRVAGGNTLTMFDLLTDSSQRFYRLVTLD